MKRNLRIWTIRITATAILIAALLILIVLYPVLTYAGKTPHHNFTIYHDQPLDKSMHIRLDQATDLVKAGTCYDPDMRLDICLDDGSRYPGLIRKLGGDAFARGFYNKVVLMAPVDWQHNYAGLHGYRWNATQLLAHEMIHCYQFRKLGLLHANPIASIPEWKWEGYPEYVARKSEALSDLSANIRHLLQAERTDHNGWIQFGDSTGTVISYYRSWLLMQYCLDVRRMSYDQVLRDTASEISLRRQMMAWYEARQDVAFY